VETLLNVVYHGIALILVIILGWNTLTQADPRKQVMSAVVMIPFVLRLLNLK
jgi:predicted membrane channel-forming protein YqfA (hemolysin III family)